MYNNFQSLLLVVLILTSLLITKETKIKTLTIKQSISFAESTKANNLISEELATANTEEVLSENSPILNYENGNGFSENLITAIPYGFFPPKALFLISNRRFLKNSHRRATSQQHPLVLKVKLL